MAARRSERGERRQQREISPAGPAARRATWRRFAFEDAYHRLLTMPWRLFFALIAFNYAAFNAIFAVLYRLQDGSIIGADRGFADAFFFSVQTMATIGYGEMRPATLYANVLVSIEVLLGLVGFALATGVIFARFSRPTARILFSDVAVVTSHDGRQTLMFRAANQRANRILEAQVTLTLARNETTAEGDWIRRLRDLPVERRRTPLFRLSWTVMHVIGAESPFHGAAPAELAANEAELIATIIGIDETLSQTVHARHSYAADKILFGRRFADILPRGDGGREIDFSRFHDTVD
ncbi:MAG TPA: ion channel [Stellaceae bacterium]|nr:ion channel [Stellaceae bacterium]